MICCGGLRRGVVGEMTVAAEDALFEAPGAADAILQHLDIVIGLEHQGMGGADAFEDQFGDVAQVGQETDIHRGGAQRKPTGSWASCGMANVSTRMSPTSKLAPVGRRRQSSRVWSWALDRFVVGRLQ